MKKTVIVFSHSDFKKSRVNKALLAQISDLEGITVHVLEEHALDFQFNIEKEQALLLEHDLIVLQFPMYWYSCPALMKHWIDEVWLYKFAYGSDRKLEGKTVVCATTAGGAAEDFQADGDYCYSVEEFFRPFEITAKFCKMNYERPFAVYNTSELTDQQIQEHANQYRLWLTNYSEAR